MQEENAVAACIPANHLQQLTYIQSGPLSKHTPYGLKIHSVNTA